jgi:polyribonucleotide nucleotidyltransferase
MLAAVMFGHKGFQPVLDAIIKLAERAAKEPRDFQTPDNAALEARMAALRLERARRERGLAIARAVQLRAAASARVRAAQAALAAGQQAYAVAQARFATGFATPFEVMRAGEALRRAESRWRQSGFALQRGELAVARALGVDLAGLPR